MRGIVGTTVLVAAVVTFAGSGCGGGEARRTARAPSAPRSASLDAPGTTSTTSAALLTSATPPKTRVPTTTTTANAVMRVATERCDRAAACKHVGTGRTFGDRDECVNAVGHDIVDVLSDEECPSGVDADRLATCVSEVQANPCEDGAKSAEALPASCTRETLCHREDVALER